MQQISVQAIVELPAEPVNASTIAPTIRANLTNTMRTVLSLGLMNGEDYK